jgi:uncharacterized protein YbjT (DUF2867 family)
MLLITGAAGPSGRLIVKALSQQGQRPRAVICHPEKAGLRLDLKQFDRMARMPVIENVGHRPPSS